MMIIIISIIIIHLTPKEQTSRYFEFSYKESVYISHPLVQPIFTRFVHTHYVNIINIIWRISLRINPLQPQSISF
jgi:hypothetical protein